jgi:hypothetical protein
MVCAPPTCLISGRPECPLRVDAVGGGHQGLRPGKTLAHPKASVMRSASPRDAAVTNATSTNFVKILSAWDFTTLALHSYGPFEEIGERLYFPFYPQVASKTTRFRIGDLDLAGPIPVLRSPRATSMAPITPDDWCSCQRYLNRAWREGIDALAGATSTHLRAVSHRRA